MDPLTLDLKKDYSQDGKKWGSRKPLKESRHIFLNLSLAF